MLDRFTPDELEAFDAEQWQEEELRRNLPEGRRLYVQPKPRARVRQDAGRVWVRFTPAPPEPVRAALKRAGAQYHAHRGAWSFPTTRAEG